MNAIEVRHVSKTFRIPHERHTTLVERLLSLFRPPAVETLAALDDVTLEIPAGQFVGVIGANGSGKSTLLKIMAGLLVPDGGDVQVNGTLSPLLELGLGFNNELTVHENVALYGAVLGYPRKEMARRVNEAIAFAELERFRDAKLKNLSSGMLVRLAFATALRADADILLLDEVLAVGDARFQAKCVDVFMELKRQRKTIVLVSHDLIAVQRFCEQVFWLDGGRLAKAGGAAEVVNYYLYISQMQGLRSVRAAQEPEAEFESRWGDGRIRFVEGRLETEDGTPSTRFRAGSRAVLRLVVEVQGDCEQPVFGMILRLGSHVVYSTNNGILGTPSRTFAASERAEVCFAFTVGLANGHYSVNVGVADRVGGTIHDWINDFTDFIVDDSHCLEGVTDLDAEFRCVPSVAVEPSDADDVVSMRTRPS